MDSIYWSAAVPRCSRRDQGVLSGIDFPNNRQRDMTASIGKLTEQSSVRRWQLDELRFTYVVDGSMWLSAKHFLNAIPAAYWEKHPDEICGDGYVAMSAGGLLVESADHTLLIDAGLGLSLIHI